MRDYISLAIGVVILAVACLAELEGVFLYSGYSIVKAMALVLAGVFSMIAARLIATRKVWPGLATLVFAGAFLVLGLVLGTLATTPRKRFYILAEQIKPNDTMESVRAKLSGYDSWSQKEGSVSFNFASGPRTTDVVVIQYDPKTSRVLSADLSLD